MRSPAVAHAPAHLEAVEVRHQHVEQDGVGGRGGLPPDRLAAVGRELHLEAAQPQDPLHRLPDGGLVVDDQDAHGAIVRREAERLLNVSGLGGRRDGAALLERADREHGGGDHGERERAVGGRAPAAELKDSWKA